jgi:crotonobetainyl-CoA:carnitine CoA-transferase CaiB-like acyl-CoA transferase
VQGIRIVDFSRVLAGPWATQHLADQGADVVKVEPPGGDETRAFAPHVDGVSTYFVSCNRGKRSIVLDLRTAAGREVARRLVAGADVVVHNWRPGVAEKVGLGGDELAAEHPRLVYVHLCAFGSAGDPRWVGRAGYDLVLQAMGGAMSFTGAPDGPPVRSGTPIADLVAGLLVCNAILHGLLERERRGRGQRIEVNMMQAQAACLSYLASRYTLAGEVETRRGNAHRGLVPYDVYACKDGRIALACGNDRIWERLRAALGIAEVEAWRTNPGRVERREAVDAAIAGALATLTVAEADARLAAADVPAGPVLGIPDVVAHPSVEMIDVPHPVLGTLRVVGPIVRTSTTVSDHRPPPALDADRDAILRDAGYDAPSIGRLAAAGAFGGPASRAQE